MIDARAHAPISMLLREGTTRRAILRARHTSVKKTNVVDECAPHTALAPCDIRPTWYGCGTKTCAPCHVVSMTGVAARVAGSSGSGTRWYSSRWRSRLGSFRSASSVMLESAAKAAKACGGVGWQVDIGGAWGRAEDVCAAGRSLAAAYRHTSEVRHEWALREGTSPSNSVTRQPMKGVYTRQALRERMCERGSVTKPALPTHRVRGREERDVDPWVVEARLQPRPVQRLAQSGQLRLHHDGAVIREGVPGLERLRNESWWQSWVGGCSLLLYVICRRRATRCGL